MNESLNFWPPAMQQKVQTAIDATTQAQQSHINSLLAQEAELRQQHLEAIAEITLLKEQIQVADKAYQALFDACGGWPGILAKDKRIAALKSLMEEAVKTLSLYINVPEATKLKEAWEKIKVDDLKQQV